MACDLQLKLIHLVLALHLESVSCALCERQSAQTIEGGEHVVCSWKLARAQTRRDCACAKRRVVLAGSVCCAPALAQSLLGAEGKSSLRINVCSVVVVD